MERTDNIFHTYVCRSGGMGIERMMTMIKPKKPSPPSALKSLRRFRLECEKELAHLDRLNKVRNSSDSD